MSNSPPSKEHHTTIAKHFGPDHGHVKHITDRAQHKKVDDPEGLLKEARLEKFHNSCGEWYNLHLWSPDIDYLVTDQYREQRLRVAYDSRNAVDIANIDQHFYKQAEAYYPVAHDLINTRHHPDSLAGQMAAVQTDVKHYIRKRDLVHKLAGYSKTLEKALETQSAKEYREKRTKESPQTTAEYLNDKLFKLRRRVHEIEGGKDSSAGLQTDIESFGVLIGLAKRNNEMQLGSKAFLKRR